jgi:hypothetical protein
MPHTDDEPEPPVIKVAHGPDDGGWSVAETANFRLFHRQPRRLAEEVLRVAERTRADQSSKWFGAISITWEPKCRVYLYGSGGGYRQATGAPATSPGHTEVSVEGGRVIARHIHLHGPREPLLTAVLPHEVTHAVLAGRFGAAPVPRWADEGMAVLAEPRDRVEAHLRHLPRMRTDRLLYRVEQLVNLHDYPPPRAVGAFYAQSVSLVDFLSRQKGARRFSAFVRDGVRDGYEASLRQHYGWDFAELERRWQRHAFGEEAARGEVGLR